MTKNQRLVWISIQYEELIGLEKTLLQKSSMPDF